MQYSTVIAIALASLATAAPVHLKARDVGLIGTPTYNDLSISGGVAGNALEEADKKLKVAAIDPAKVAEADVDVLGDVNKVGNKAEKEAFNGAIEAATGEEKLALQRGKIKNKVLKLDAEVLELKAEVAQGGDESRKEKLAEEQKKLDKNVALDQAEAGKESKALLFDAQTGPDGVGAARAAAKTAAGAKAKDGAKDKGADAEGADAEAAAGKKSKAGDAGADAEAAAGKKSKAGDAGADAEAAAEKKSKAGVAKGAAEKKEE